MYMEKENINVHQDSFHSSEQNPTLSSSNISNRKSNLILILGIVILILLISTGAYLLGAKNSQLNKKTYQQLNLPSPTAATEYKPTSSVTNKIPRFVAFMRKGEVWIKDFSTGQEKKISKSEDVGSPQFSPDGRHVLYFEIIHFGGGFPRYPLYLTDINGTFEKSFPLLYAPGFSKLKWSNDGKYLATVLVSETFPLQEKAFIYDTILQKEISLGEVGRSSKEISDDLFTLLPSCENIQHQYMELCNEYVLYLSVSDKNKSIDDTQIEYRKRQEYQVSKYTKPNYNLITYKKLDNGLVVLEYYIGEPQNPEAQWGIGGGSFIPGYDKGVTEIYTLLIDETTGEVIKELPLAIDTDFLF